jgi:hypothetical protein
LFAFFVFCKCPVPKSDVRTQRVCVFAETKLKPYDDVLRCGLDGPFRGNSPGGVPHAERRESVEGLCAVGGGSIGKEEAD